MPYLCGFWRFANTYYKQKCKEKKIIKKDKFSYTCVVYHILYGNECTGGNA